MFADAVIVVGWGTTILCTGIWVAYLAGWARLLHKFTLLPINACVLRRRALGLPEATSGVGPTTIGRLECQRPSVRWLQDSNLPQISTSGFF
jgi:hypothetical protein